jgi:ATP-dependent DNA ligase
LKTPVGGEALERPTPQARLVPLSAREAKLAKLLARKPAGIVVDEHIGEDSAVVFLHACKIGLESIASKRLTAP